MARFVIGPKSVGPREISKAISCQMGGLAPGPATKSTSAQVRAQRFTELRVEVRDWSEELQNPRC